MLSIQHVHFLSTTSLIDMNDENTKQIKNEIKTTMQNWFVLSGLCREMDARRKFAEHERSELLEVKPRAILASRVPSELPLCIHDTISTRLEHQPIIL